MRIGRPSGLVVVAGGIAVVGVLASLVLGGADETSGGVGYDPANGEPRLMAVDERGAVLTSPSKTWGVRRDGSVMWSVPAAELAPLYAVCAPRCPAAVLSGDANALGSPLAQDPSPQPAGGGSLPQILLAATGGKAEVLSYVGGAGLRLGSDADGRPSWTTTRSGSHRVLPARSGFVDWFPTSDGSAALVSSDLGEAREQQVWIRSNRTGWRPRGRPDTVRSGFGCVSRDASHWTLGGRRLAAAGGSVDLGLAQPFGNCAFTSGRLVTVDHRMRADGASSQMRVFDLRGRLVRDVGLRGEQWLVADARGPRFATVGSGRAVLYDGRGLPDQEIAHVVDARWTAAGTLVVLSRSGRVTWR